MRNVADGAPTEFQFQTEWPEGVTENAQVVNAFAMVNDQSSGQPGIYLLVGHLGAPVWLTPDIAAQRFKELDKKLTIAPRGAFFMSRDRAEELWKALGTHLGKEISQG